MVGRSVQYVVVVEDAGLWEWEWQEGVGKKGMMRERDGVAAAPECDGAT